ncbi:MAG: hypothetical protein HC849_08575 [Oscillatoriales cyanobacterium RU_3_3]|nr:hypothetical protein [Oscillatoriales cyanobacterium RU_3_3]NJR23622.1 hypothetical protein [Richelia sp. CSU_2_1]
MLAAGDGGKVEIPASPLPKAGNLPLPLFPIARNASLQNCDRYWGW